ncbi:unnamed protein product [Pylaiella littoralis]
MSDSIPTMLWEDGIALLGGDDSKSGAGEAIIPDSHPGSGSSVPGGPGVRTAKERVLTGAQDPTTVSKESTVKVEKRDRKPKKVPEDFGVIRAGVEELVAKMSKAVDHEIRRGETEVGDGNLTRLEELTDKTRSLKEKIAAAEADGDDDSETMYNAVLCSVEAEKKNFLRRSRRARRLKRRWRKRPRQRLPVQPTRKSPK